MRAVPVLPVLSPGSTDLTQQRPVVSTVQIMLREVEASLAADGVLGERTRSAIMAFQRTSRREPNGVLTGADWRLLCTRPR